MIFNKGVQALADILILIWRLLMLAHIFACVWFYLGESQRLRGENNWISHYEMDQYDNVDKYVNSFYFSVVTVNTIVRRKKKTILF